MRYRKKEKRICFECQSEFEVRSDRSVKLGRGKFCPNCCHKNGGRSMRNKYPLKPAKHQELARWARNEVRKAKLTPNPCQKCNASAEAHHEDYSKPLKIDWLCSKHHIQRHLEM